MNARMDASCYEPACQPQETVQHIPCSPTRCAEPTRLLLVETNRHVISTLRNGLRNQGYDLEVVSSGESALNTASLENYAAIILEVLLPDMDGRDLCRKWRRAGYNRPILILTTVSDLSHKIDGFHAGADDYITKPFSMDELAARLSAAVRRARIFVTPPTLEHEALVLDCSSCQVTWKSSPIDLTAREFELLKCLMEHKGDVLNHEYILERAWNQQNDPLTNIVAVYIRRLREKLQQAGAPPLIATVRGFGYRFSQRDEFR